MWLGSEKGKGRGFLTLLVSFCPLKFPLMTNSLYFTDSSGYTEKTNQHDIEKELIY